MPWRSNAGGLDGMGWVLEYHSPGTSPGMTFFSGIGQTGLPVSRSRTNRKLCLVGWASALMIFPLCGMSHRIAAQGTS